MENKLGTKIKDIRLKKGLSQCQLAKRMKVTQSYVSKIESGVAKPNFDFLQKFRRKLKVNINKLC